METGQQESGLIAPGEQPALLDLVAMPHFALSITTRCQQRCAFCFEGERGRRLDVPFERVEEQLLEASRSVSDVVFMGAESTLHPSFVQLVRRATDLGLGVAVSTNLQRFADHAFVDQCVEAGLRRVEVSFHYPDAAVFESITRTPARRFDRLLRALDNLEAVAVRRRSTVPQVDDFGVNVNIVVCSGNVDRIDEVLAHLAHHMPTAFRVATFKRLETTTLAGERAACSIDPHWIPSGAALRANLKKVFDTWAHRDVLPVLRGFPLCVAGAHEEHHVDLVFHGRRSLVSQNFGPTTEFSAMYEYSAPCGQSVVLEACERCSVGDLCHCVTGGKLALIVPSLEPRPSLRDPLDVLRGSGLRTEDAEELMTRSHEARARQRTASVSTPALEPRQVEKLLQLALQRVGHRFGNAKLVRVQHEAHEEWGRVVAVELQTNAQRIVLWLSGKQPGAKSFEAGARFMIVHAPTTPLRSRQEQDLARVVLRVCERVLPST